MFKVLEVMWFTDKTGPIKAFTIKCRDVCHTLEHRCKLLLLYYYISNNITIHIQ